MARGRAIQHRPAERVRSAGHQQAKMGLTRRPSGAPPLLHHTQLRRETRGRRLSPRLCRTGRSRTRRSPRSLRWSSQTHVAAQDVVQCLFCGTEATSDRLGGHVDVVMIAMFERISRVQKQKFAAGPLERLTDGRGGISAHKLKRAAGESTPYDMRRPNK